MRKLLVVVLVLALLGAAFGYWAFIMPNVNGNKKITVKIPSNSSFTDVLALLRSNHVLKSEFTFVLTAKYKGYPDAVKAGNYVFSANMNNRQLVNMLKLGLQTPVKLVIYNVRTKEDFAGLVGRVLELDSTQVITALNDSALCKKYKLDTANILTHFISDNYELYWNTSLPRFIEKMDTAYERFWTDERRARAKALNLTPSEVYTLAAIVEKEVIFDKELTTVAGVYLNRLRIGMPLQADPTLVFALRDFTARRVTQKHKDYDSPYNTYKYAGLPPGPICMPYKKSIDAVLNAEEHKYLYFCANPDMSGYSIFSVTYEEQMRTADLYRKKLNAMKILK